MKETEIRIGLSSALRNAAKRYFDARGSVSELNHTTYYDTPDQTLWRAGFECRVRKNARGIRQTVKSRGGHTSFSRMEQEKALIYESPDRDHLCQSLPKSIRDKIKDKPLERMFTTDVMRRRFIEETTAGAVEGVLDIGRIAHPRNMPSRNLDHGTTTTHEGTGAGGETDNGMEIAEVEFELIEGGFDALVDHVRRFLDDVPGSLQMLGKADRGYGLLRGGKPKPVKAEAASLPHNTPIPQALTQVLSNALAQVARNHPAVMAGEPEAIHQMRIGLRRFRSAITGFRPALDIDQARPLLKEAWGLFRDLGSVRDADVFLAETLTAIPAQALDDAPRRALIATTERFRDRKLDAIRKLLGGPEFALLLVKLQAWVERGGWLREERPLDALLKTRTVGEFAYNRHGLLERKLRKAGGIAMRGEAEDWHRVRKCLKQVRYSNEYFLVGLEQDKKTTKRYEKAIARLQKDLGHFNDLACVPALLERLSTQGGKRGGAAKEFEIAAACCAGWSLAMTEQSVERLRSDWQTFIERDRLVRDAAAENKRPGKRPSKRKDKR